MSQPPTSTRRRSRLLVAALLVVGLALLGAAAWLWLGQRDSRPESTSSSPQPPTPTPTTNDQPPATVVSGQLPVVSAGRSFAPAVLSGFDGGFAALGCAQAADPAAPAVAALDGELAVWQPLTLRFSGPAAAEGDSDPNPFLDYRLTVRFLAPSGRA